MKKEYVRCPWSPVAFDGWLLILPAVLTAVLFASVYWNPENSMVVGLVILSSAYSAFALWFFRDPSRAPAAQGNEVVVSAADGTVLKVESLQDSRYGGQCEKISIFMSPLNVHVNRSPVQGVVEKVEYIPGKFFAANLDKASTDNERNWVCIKRPDGVRIAFLQIAGFIARRIVCRVQVGDQLDQSQRYGMIRFGSRMEMFLPPGTQILVKPGDKLEAGHTVVAHLR